jgi:hypothetical protein
MEIPGRGSDTLLLSLANSKGEKMDSKVTRCNCGSWKYGDATCGVCKALEARS